MTTELEDMLFLWEEYCNKKSKIHYKMRAIYRNMNLYIAIPAIVISAISGSGTISLSSHLENLNVLAIVFGTMALVASAMFSIHRYLQLPELQREYDFYGDEFEKLRLEINLQLILARDEAGISVYTNLSEFAKEVKKRLDILIDKGPAFFQRVEKNIEKKMIEDMN
jgi:hypothetical protein